MRTTNLTIEAEAGAEAKERWGDTIRGVFGAVDMTIPRVTGFSGRMNVVSFGAVELTTVASSGEDATRTARHIGRDGPHACVLSFVREGSISVQQAGRECTVGPGSAVLFDLQRPYRYAHREWSEVFSIKLPGDTLRSRVAHLDSRLAAVRGVSSGVGRVIRDTLESFARESPGIPELVGADVANRLTELVAIGLEVGNDGNDLLSQPVGRAALFRRAVTYMDAHLADVTLNPSAIAAAVGISVRYLHAVFEEQASSVGDTLRRRRLARGYEALRLSPLTPVKDVAARCGFRSQAHFCASFRREYQLSPTEVRASSAAGGPV